MEKETFEFKAYSEDKLKVVEAIAFDLLDFIADETDFDYHDVGRMRKILDFSQTANTSVFDIELIEQVIYELDENWLTNLAGRPISKLYTNLTAIAL
jgi:hypothetical protein